MKVSIICFVVSIFALTAKADDTRQNIYYDVNAFGYCIRRLNATHQVGCSSSRKGNVGVLHYIASDADLQWLLDHGMHEPYIVLVTPNYYKRSVIDAIKGKITGVAVIRTNDTTVTNSSSPDSRCPGQAFELYRDNPTYSGCVKAPWNVYGEDLLWNDFDFPIVALTNITEVNQLIEYYMQFNNPVDGVAREYPQLALQIRDAMDAAVNTPTCIRRSNKVTNLNPQTFCDPLANSNVYVFPDKPQSGKKLVIAAARIDSISMFETLYPSADSSISGIVTLMATAEALLRRNESFYQAPKNLLFVLFNAESLDYSGSIRFVYDMKNGHFHGFQPSDIDTFVEISQVGLQDMHSLWLHTDPISRNSPDVNKSTSALLTLLEKHAKRSNLTITESTNANPLPPASLQSFLKVHNISAATVVTDFNKEFSNRFYHSMYDNRSNLGLPVSVNSSDELENTEAVVQLTKLSNTLARSLFELVNGSNAPDDLAVNISLVAELLYCYLYEPTCRLFNASVNGDFTDFWKVTVTSPGFGYYSSVNEENVVTVYTRRLLALFQGQPVKNMDKMDCEAIDKKQRKVDYRYYWVNGLSGSGMCLRANANLTTAKSPAFDIEGYDLSSSMYPAWTESRWSADATFVRAFLLPPRYLEIAELVTGLLLFTISMLVVFIINRRAHLLFGVVGHSTQDLLLPFDQLEVERLLAS